MMDVKISNVRNNGHIWVSGPDRDLEYHVELVRTNSKGEEVEELTCFFTGAALLELARQIQDNCFDFSKKEST